MIKTCLQLSCAHRLLARRTAVDAAASHVGRVLVVDHHIRAVVVSVVVWQSVVVARQSLVVMMAVELSMVRPVDRSRVSAQVRALCRSSEPCVLPVECVVAPWRVRAFRSWVVCSLSVHFRLLFAPHVVLAIRPSPSRGFLPYHRFRSQTSLDQEVCSRFCKGKVGIVSQAYPRQGQPHLKRTATYLSGSALCT